MIDIFQNLKILCFFKHTLGITRHGAPAATTFGGIPLVVTLPAPINTLFLHALHDKLRKLSLPNQMHDGKHSFSLLILHRSPCKRSIFFISRKKRQTLRGFPHAAAAKNWSGPSYGCSCLCLLFLEISICRIIQQSPFPVKP